MPKLYKHLKKMEFDSKLMVFQWFVCLYSSYLNPEVHLKVMDLFLIKGVKVIFSTGIAIFETLQKELMGL